MATTSIAAKEVKASDVIDFAGTQYKVRSVLRKSDHVEIVYWGTNGEQPYWYEPESPLHIVKET